MIILGSFVAVAVPLALLFHFVHRRVYRSIDRTIFDAIPFLMEVDYDQLDALLDATDEQNLREHLSKREFRGAQEKRIRLLLELLRRMVANARVLVELGESDQRRGWRAGQPEWVELGAGLAEAGIKFWGGAAFIQIAMHWRLVISVLFPFVKTGNISPVRNSEGFDLFDCYQKMVDAALNLGQAYGDDIHQRLARAL
jgi:hypothetical protein